MKFLKAHPNICSKEEFERIQRENLNNKEEMIGDDDSETDNDMNESTAKDEYDFMDDAQILFALKSTVHYILPRFNIGSIRKNIN
jgi:hypothetical protein